MQSPNFRQKTNNVPKSRFTRAQLLAKKKRFISTNNYIVSQGGRARPLPAIFRNLGRQRKRAPFIGPRRKPNRLGRRNTRTTKDHPGVSPDTKAKIDRAEQRSQVNLKVVTVGQHLQSPYQWDYSGLQYHVEVLANKLSIETDLFFQITPCEFAFYCVYVTLSFLQRTGGLAGVTFIPMSADRSTLPVPHAIAKYLEYLAPYEKGDIKVQTMYYAQNTAAFFNTTPSYTALGQNTGVWASRPAWFPNWRILPANKDNEFNHVTFAYNNEGGTTFTSFVTNPQYINRIAKAVMSSVKCVELKHISIIAPDSSAYARLTIPFTSDNTTNPLAGQIRGLDSNFDPEMTILLAPQATGGVNFTSSFVKPYPLPTINRSVPLVNSFGQLAFVFQYLAEMSDYKSGKAKNAYQFHTDAGQFQLDTFYPSEQPTDGIGLSTIVNQNHAIIIASQSSGNVAVLDSKNNLLVLEAMITYSVFQRRLNLTEVIHWNVPPCADDAGVLITLPQLFYSDAAFSNVELPLLQSAFVFAHGPVVIDGKLRIPGSDYAGVLTHAEGQLVGPYYWGVSGFDNTYDTVYGMHTTYSTAWGTQGSATVTQVPNIIIDNSPITSLTGPWANDNYGAQPSYQAFEILHPAIPTGGVATTLLSTYNDQLQEGQFGQSVVTAPIGERTSGDLDFMGTVITRDSEDYSIASTQPQGFPEGLETGNNTAIVLGGASKIASLTPQTPETAALVGLFSIGDINAQSEQTAVSKQLFINMKRWKLQQPGTVSTDPNRDISAPQMTDIPWGTGVGGLLSQLSRALMTPTSKTSEAIQKAINAPGYDPIELVKKQVGPILERSMKGSVKQDIPVKEYVGKNANYKRGKKEKKKNFADGLVIGADTGVKITESVVKGIKSVMTLF